MKTILKSLLNQLSPKTDKKKLIFLSDDWGSIRIKSKEDQEALKRNGLNINNRFDKYDSLETNADLELLFQVLTKHKDDRGNHPVFTAVTNVGNPDFEKIATNGFNGYAYETIDQTYKRYPGSDRVLSLFMEGISGNFFIPQSHGREHLQVNWWMQELKEENGYARKFFQNEFYFLSRSYLQNPRRGRGLSAAFDVWDENDLVVQKEIIVTGLNDFENLFGYRSRMFTPPAIFYSPCIENELVTKGIEWLDVGRFFKVPRVGKGESYQLNYLGRKRKSGIRVLVRNGMFEPNISDTDNQVNRALLDIEQAFKAKQPAILSNHRSAFAGRIDDRNRAKGLKALDELLGKVLKKWPDVQFITPKQLFDNAS